ncbi:MAG: biotin synthase BioB, partial [Vulcanimicrobiaceae bacterium]
MQANTVVEDLLPKLPAGRALLRELAGWPAERTTELLSLAGAVRDASAEKHVSLEVLYNAKKGGCSEDCAFCSQAA